MPRAFDLLAAGVAAIHRRNPDFAVSARSTVQSRNCAHPARYGGSRPRSGTEVDLISRGRCLVGGFQPLGIWSFERQNQVALASGQISVLEAEVEALIGAGSAAGSSWSHRKASPHRRSFSIPSRSSTSELLRAAMRLGFRPFSRAMALCGPAFSIAPIGTVGRRRIARRSPERPGGHQLSPRAGCFDERRLPALRLFIELERRGVKVQFATAAVLAVAPLLILPGWVFYYDVTPKVAVVLAGATIGLLLFLRDSTLAETRRFWTDPLGRCFCVLTAAQIASLLLSSLFSSHPALAWYGGNWRRSGFVSQSAVLALAFLIAASLRESGLRIMLHAITVAGTAAALYGIFQYFGVDPFLPSAAITLATA